jgi:hypothetical protein
MRMLAALGRGAALAAAFVVLAALPALAQTTTFDQLNPPLTSSSGQAEWLMQQEPVTGGTIYFSILRQPGIAGQPIAAASSFVPAAAGGLVRNLPLIDAHSDLGVPLTAAPGTPAGTVGVVRTAGTSLTLDGEATSGSAKTDKAIWERNLPDTYVPNANIALVVNCNYTGAGTVTAGSTTMTVAAYTEVNGVETALTVSAAQQIPAAAGNLTFTITGTGLTPGARVMFELVMLVTSSSGANTGHVNSVSFTG